MMRVKIKEKILNLISSLRTSLLMWIILDSRSWSDARYEFALWLIGKALAAAPHDIRGEWMRYRIDTHYLQRRFIRRTLLTPPLTEKELAGLISSFPKW